MLTFHHREEAIERINRLAGERVPFVFIISYAQDLSYIERADEIDPSELLYCLNGHTNCPACPPVAPDGLRWEAHPEPFTAYRKRFDRVMDHIRKGNSFLTNLTCATPVDTNLSLKDLFFRSHARYKIWMKDRFTVFSPETFVRLEGRKIRSYPMKGTADANVPGALQRLMADPKEEAEHATIVDLIRNDLSMVAEDVRVTRYRYAETLSTHTGDIIQTSSEICGTLAEDCREHLGDILFRMLPAGSVTGAPKRKTTDIIAEAEGYDRGFYTGIAGFSDGNRTDSAVMIRFVEEDAAGRLWFKSGGGITCRSDAQKEYEEMKRKIYVPVY